MIHDTEINPVYKEGFILFLQMLFQVFCHWLEINFLFWKFIHSQEQ